MRDNKDAPTRNEHFPRIPATPEQLAKALLRTKPRKRANWDYTKGRKNREDNAER